MHLPSINSRLSSAKSSRASLVLDSVLDSLLPLGLQQDIILMRDTRVFPFQVDLDSSVEIREIGGGTGWFKGGGVGRDFGSVYPKHTFL